MAKEKFDKGILALLAIVFIGCGFLFLAAKNIDLDKLLKLIFK